MVSVTTVWSSEIRKLWSSKKNLPFQTSSRRRRRRLLPHFLHRCRLFFYSLVSLLHSSTTTRQVQMVSVATVRISEIRKWWSSENKITFPEIFPPASSSSSSSLSSSLSSFFLLFGLFVTFFNYNAASADGECRNCSKFRNSEIMNFRKKTYLSRHLPASVIVVFFLTFFIAVVFFFTLWSLCYILQLQRGKCRWWVSQLFEVQKFGNYEVQKKKLTFPDIFPPASSSSSSSLSSFFLLLGAFAIFFKWNMGWQK